MSEPIAADGEPFPAEAPELDSRERFPDAPAGDLVHYEGRWVAVRDGEVVADADDEATLRASPGVLASDLVYPIGEPPSGFYLINV